MPLRRGWLLAMLDDLPLGLALWPLEVLRWLLSGRLLWEELWPPSVRLSFRWGLSLRDFPERLLSLLRDEEVEEVVLPTLAAGWVREESGSSPRLVATESTSGCSWRLGLEAAGAGATVATFSLLFPELPFSRSLVLFFLDPCCASPESRTLLDFLRGCFCALLSLPTVTSPASSLSYSGVGSNRSLVPRSEGLAEGASEKVSESELISSYSTRGFNALTAGGAVTLWVATLGPRSNDSRPCFVDLCRFRLVDIDDFD